MKPVIFIIIVLVSLSCLKLSNNEYYIRMTSEVEISHVIMPDTVDNNSPAEIIVRAKAPNGCWSDLNFILTKDNLYEYSLKAFGIYESYGSCPEVIVYGDSTITFQPDQAGLYKFYIYKGYNDLEIDTLIVR
jgi:hypothetical protein